MSTFFTVTSTHGRLLPANPGRDSLSLRGHRLLLVEDLPDSRRKLLHALQNAGTDVVLECNAFAAADVALASPYSFDAVIMDLQATLVDGLEATARLRHAGYARPVIALASSGNEVLKHRFLRVGYSALVIKSAIDSEFVATISRVIEFLCSGSESH